MARHYCFSAVLLVCCMIVSVSPAEAQWVKDGAGLCVASGSQYNVKGTHDANGGAIIAWVDMRDMMNSQIFAQRVDVAGNPLWTADGVQVFATDAGQGLCGIIADGSGGAIVVWLDNRGVSQDIYAQRIDADGNAQWAPEGIVVCAEAGEQWDGCIIADGSGGAIISWADNRGGNVDIYAQRIAGNGTVYWAPGGVAVCANLNNQYNPEMVPDGFGGAIIIWSDYRSGNSDIYAQRINASGTALWGGEDVAICAVNGSQSAYKIVANPSGGAYIAWSDTRDGFSDLYVQRIDSDGDAHWESDGLAVIPEYWNKFYPQITIDNYGGMIVVWYDQRGDDGTEVFAQRLDGDGDPQWLEYGKRVFGVTGEGDIRIMKDGAGGVIVALDVYYDESSTSDIYVQRLDTNGNALWGLRGAAVCVASESQYNPELIPYGSGGAIIAWEDLRVDGSEPDIYCQCVGPEGIWGDPEPAILSCLDVPQDQGGWVRVRTRASSHDVAGEYDSPIAGYNVWRLIESGGEPIAALANAATSAAEDRPALIAALMDPAGATGVRLDAATAALLGLPEGEWESVGFWYATRDTVYNIAVPTKNDSTEAGIPQEIYVVTAHFIMAGVFAASEPDTGYSVDNLAPGMTEGFAGDEVVSPSGLVLAWTPNPASDLWKYDIHRGDDALFVPETSNLLGSTGSTEYLDDTWVRAYQYFYKLVAVDRHGNASPAALLRPEDVNVGVLLQSYAAVLSGSCVEIMWALAEADAEMSFAVLRSEGAGASFTELASVEIEREGLSFVMVDRSVEPGTVYIYRVDVIDESGRRTLFETEAIATPASPLTLQQNHPNPFNPSTTINYYLPSAAPVTLEVYDAAGRLVSRLLEGARQERGVHSVAWRGVDDAGRAVSSGVYFYRLRAGRETLTRKMVLLR